MDEKKKSLRIVYQLGTGDGGKELTKSHTYSGLRPDSTDENLKKAADALAGLCVYSMSYAEVSTVQRLK